MSIAKTLSSDVTRFHRNCPVKCLLNPQLTGPFNHLSGGMSFYYLKLKHDLCHYPAEQFFYINSNGYYNL